jgi:GTP-binding protein EngB required for normal cell division
MKAADPSMEMGARSGALERHLKTKLELAALIRSIMQQFHDAKDDRREGQARKLLSRLAEDQFNLAVVGQFKRGKSSLMNAVIGMDRLPTGVLPLTSVVTTVRYGDHEHALIRTRGATLPHEIPLSRLEEYVTERGNPGNRKQVALADVRLPAEVLRLGFHFIDTPGVGSAIAANTATTHEFLPEADAVIFVTSFESAMNEGELAFLRAVARHVHKILFVVNKRDLVSAEESEAVLASIRETISAQLGEAEPRVFALSAREGLEAKLTGNRELLSRSGLVEFESFLTRFLTEDKARVALLRCVERMTALLAPERVESRVSTIRANLSGEAARRMKAEWERRVEQIDAECLRTAESLRCHVRSDLPSRFQDAVEEHCAEVRGNLRAQMESILSREEKFSIAQDLRDLSGRAETTAEELLREWVANYRPVFVENLWSLAAGSVDKLERLYREMLNVAADLFAAPPEGANWSVGKDEAIFSWTAAAPFEWRPRFAWELEVLSRKWVLGRVRREYLRTLDAAVEAYRDRVTQAIADAGGEWAGRLSSGIQSAIRNLGSQVAAAMEGRAPSAVSNEAGELLKRLDRIRQDLAEGGPEETLAGPAPIGERRLIRPCFVCERIASEMFDFFSKRQYELAMNEAQQRAHAANGGFCPLHTWQYEHIASPHGVCLAYAPLLAGIARHLRGIASSGSTLRSMREGIGDLYSPARCPACLRLAEAEKAAVEDFRHAPAGAGLCLLHLGAVLGKETDVELARSLIFEQASVLDRVSQDMQSYALKHDAVRRELATDEEWLAYLSGLSLVAGAKKLFVA